MTKKISIRRRLPRNRLGSKTYQRIGEIYGKMLEAIEGFQKHCEKVLNEILSLDKKIDAIIEKRTRWIVSR
jgi:DNA anti-recombination protein RmuC